MSYGLQLSAAGVLTSMYRMDVYANNLANTDTVGFKADIPAALTRKPVTEEDADAGMLPSNKMLERLGGGTLAFPTATSHTQASLRSTGNDLDLAIQGDGFFVTRDVADAGGDALRFTRDGRFTRNADGLLVMATTGMPVLDVSGNSIKLPNGKVTVDADGTIRHGQAAVARVQITDVPDRSRLRKQGHSLFTAPADAMSSRFAATGSIRQNHIEESGVDEVRTLLNVTSAARDIESNLAMIQQHDRLMERAIAVLGRVN
ncbi:MAG: flagellar hook basal-body protein [Phycisphaerales bacterium]|jgi:flagellar basal-body rod protein FlgF|nr:flagellar hook basal-body protein [Phycisphaerales bacterium]